MTRDARRTPARPDLAATGLKGEVKAERYADARPMRVAVPLAPLTFRPDGDANMETQLLYGEAFDVYDLDGAWAWGQCRLDGYVGYVPGACLEPDTAEPTHRVAVPMTHVYPAPRVQARPAGWLTYGARVRVAGPSGDFLALETGGFIPARHLLPAAELTPDWVAEAERFLEAPYLWGGRSVAGIDCSGVIQLARQAAGLECPRDSDMQMNELGETLDPAAPLARGDLVFWKRHVGVMLDATRLLHANGHHMATRIEPLQAAIDRIAAKGEGPVLRHARLDGGAGAS